MTKQRRTGTKTTLRELAENLIDAGAVALTTYDDFDGEQILLVIHRPTADTQTDSRIRSVCQNVQKVNHDDKMLFFDYVVDPYPPSSFGKVGIYLPERFAGESELEFGAISLNEGLNNLTNVGGETTKTA